MDELRRNDRLQTAPARIADHVSIARRYVRAADLGRDLRDPEALAGFVVTPAVREALRRLTTGLMPRSGQRAFRITGPYGSGKSSFGVLLAQFLHNGVIGDRARTIVDEHVPDAPATKAVVLTLVGRRVSLGDDLLTRLLDPGPDAPSPTKALRAAIETTCQQRRNGALDPEVVLDHLDAYAAEVALTDHMLVLLVDEMGRYIEYSASSEGEDPSIFQRLAERACGPRDSTFGVVAFLHSRFADYVTGMGRWAEGEWARSAERYEDIAFGNGEEAATFLLASAMTHVNADPAVQSCAAALYEEAADRGLFAWEMTKAAPDATALYPLHPAVVVALVAASRRLGQSERSMFSFLASQEPAGLMRFANKTAYDPRGWYRLSDFYDYLSAQPSLNFATRDRDRRWSEVQETVWREHDRDPLIQAVLKTAGLLLVLDPVSGLRADAHTLAWCLGASLNDVAGALDTLIEHGALWRRPGGTLALRGGSAVDLDRWREEAERHVPRVPALELREPYTFVAHRHYHETGTLRAFPLVVASDPKAVSAPFGDGMVCLVPVLCEADAARACARAKTASQTASLDSIFCVVRVAPEAIAAAHDLAVWTWVGENCAELRLDATARAEVAARCEAAGEAVLRDLRPFAAQGGGETLAYYHDGQAVEIASRRDLNARLSDACDARFSGAPILRNDLINRSRLSSAISTARGRLFEAMLAAPDKTDLGLTGAPPERTIYLTMLRQAGLHRPDPHTPDVWHFDAPPADDPLRWRPAWNALANIVGQADGSDVVTILNHLEAAPIGLRSGPAIVLLATYMIVERGRIALLERGTYRPDLDASLLMRLAKGPQHFHLRALGNAETDSEGVGRIADILRNRPGVPVLPRDPAVGELTAAIYGWTAKLPPFAWQTRSISRRAQAVRSVLRKARDPIDLLHHGLPNACECADSTDAVFAELLDGIFDEIEHAGAHLRDRVRATTLEAFGARTIEDLRVRLRSDFEPVLLRLTVYRLRALVDRSLNPDLDADAWLGSIASLLTGKRIEAWDDQTLDSYTFAVRECAGQLDRFLALTKQAGRVPVAAVHVTLPNGADASYYIRSCQKPAEDAVTASIRQLIAGADDPQRVLSALLAEMLNFSEVET